MSDKNEKDKEAVKTLVIVVSALVVLTLVLGVVANYFLIDDDHNVNPDWVEKQVLDRIAPVGNVATTVAEAKDASPAAAAGSVDSTEDTGPLTGDKVYNTVCMACHAAGLPGIPKVGDAAQWGPRVAQGIDVLYEHAIKGFKAMPARGGSGNLTDQNVKDAVDYMVENSK